MNFADAVSSVFKQYANFSGRARRSEFWWFYLFSVIVSVVVGAIDAAIGSSILGIIVGLALIVPQLAVGSRRLHDTGRSGWFQLVAIIPIIGIIVLIVFFCQDSSPKGDQYGPSPKYGSQGQGGYAGGGYAGGYA